MYFQDICWVRLALCCCTTCRTAGTQLIPYNFMFLRSSAMSPEQRRAIFRPGAVCGIWGRESFPGPGKIHAVQHVNRARSGGRAPCLCTILFELRSAHHSVPRPQQIAACYEQARWPETHIYNVKLFSIDPTMAASGAGQVLGRFGKLALARSAPNLRPVLCGAHS